MKKAQMIIAIPSSLLLLFSLLTSYKAGLFIVMAGLFIALLLRQIRLWKYGGIFNYPSRGIEVRGRKVSIMLIGRNRFREDGGVQMSQMQGILLGVVIGIALAIGFNVGIAVTDNMVMSIVIAIVAGLLARVVGKLIIKRMK